MLRRQKLGMQMLTCPGPFFSSVSPAAFCTAVGTFPVSDAPRRWSGRTVPPLADAAPCRPLPLRPRAPTPAWCPAARYHLRRLVTRSETSKLVCTLETFGVSGIGHRADCCTFKLTTDKDKGPLLRVDARRPRHVTVYPAAGLGLFKFQVLWTRMVRAMYSTSTSSAALHTTSQLSGPNSNR